MSRDVALMSATELLRHYRRGTLSPVEATEAALGQVEHPLIPQVDAVDLRPGADRHEREARVVVHG